MASRRAVRPFLRAAVARGIAPGGVVFGAEGCSALLGQGGPLASNRGGDAAAQLGGKLGTDGVHVPIECHSFASKFPAAFSEAGAPVPVVPLGSGLGLLTRSFSAATALPPHQQIAMPSLSPTMTQGNIARWLKAVGDEISAGDVLCEIETDKATLSMESMEDGFLARILLPDGSKDIPVGTPIAVMVDSKDDVPSFADYATDAGAAPAAAAPAAAPAAEKPPAPSEPAPPPSDLPPYSPIAMPSLSPTMTQGNIVRWRKAVGDQVSPGDVLCEIETDKATLEMESMDEGYVARILQGDGSKDVAVGTPIAVLVEDTDAVPKFANFTPPPAAGASAAPAAPKAVPVAEAAAPPPPPPPPPPPAAAAPKAAAPAAPAPPTRRGGRVFASPAAKKLALDSKVDLALVVGTGPDGRVIKADVEDYLKAPRAPPSAAALPAVPPSELRQHVAARFVEAVQTIPHYYLSLDTRVDKLQSLLADLNVFQERSGEPPITVEHVLIKAAALATKKVPACNSSWAGEFITQFESVDVSLSVYTENGLTSPVVKDADTRGLASIAAEVERLKEAAAAGTLTPEDTAGGTFSFSSVAEFGLKSASSIINPPQACIVTVGAAQSRVVPGASPSEFENAAYVTATLSCDHRVVDGAVGAEWLAAFKSYVEDPVSLLL